MKTQWYTVAVLDADGCDMTGGSETQGKANAIAAAKCYLTDPEYVADVAALIVRDAKGVIVWDWKREHASSAEAKQADRIDGYDRDDLGESPDY
jgi:hypothetical protein